MTSSVYLDVRGIGKIEIYCFHCKQQYESAFIIFFVHVPSKSDEATGSFLHIVSSCRLSKANGSDYRIIRHRSRGAAEPLNTS